MLPGHGLLAVAFDMEQLLTTNNIVLWYHTYSYHEINTVPMYLSTPKYNNMGRTTPPLSLYLRERSKS